jgi:2Fe-2S ferredoxin
MPKILFLPADKYVEIRGEPSVLDLALKNKIPLDHSCGGSGSCGTCRVFIEGGGPVGARNDIEAAMAEDRQFTDFERLACQIEPVDGLVVRTPEPVEESDDES